MKTTTLLFSSRFVMQAQQFSYTWKILHEAGVLGYVATANVPFKITQ